MQRYLLGSFLLLAASGCMQNDGVAEGGASSKLSDAEANQRLLQSKNLGDDLPAFQGDPAEIPSPDEVSVVNSLDFATVSEKIQKSLPAQSPDPLKKSSAVVRTVDYNQSESIAWTPDQSWNTFTYGPFYIQRLHNTWGYTVPQTNNHYHLMYENSEICDFHSNTGKIGLYVKKLTWSQAECKYLLSPTPECAPTGLDAKDFYRYITTHHASDWIKFFVSDNGSTPKVFDLVSIKIMPPDPNILSCDPNAGKIQIWVKKAATQKWLYWKGLKPGKVWSPYPADGNDIDEIRLTSPNSEHFGADDLTVRVR